MEYVIKQWYELRLLDGQRVLGQCIGITKNFITLNIGYSYEPDIKNPDTTIERLHMIEYSAIRKSTHIEGRRIESKERGNTKYYVKSLF